MCGLAGHFNLQTCASPLEADVMESMVRRMNTMLVHRGPDACGYWAAPDATVALGHQRLSIIDLSPTGAQPMTSASGRYIIAYNGEIYGFQKLARDLEQEGARFRGASDTEVLLAAIEAWGVEEAVSRVNGMFAFALWDGQRRTLTFARDKAGKKPIYIARTRHGISFASELGPLVAHAQTDKSISANALAMYMRYYAVPAPHTIFENVWKLPAATTLTIDTATNPADLENLIANASCFWSAAETALAGQSVAIAATPNDTEAVSRIEDVLTQAVMDRMVSDVPLGAFLSGGIDSTCIVTLMQHHVDQKINTFTVGFNEDGYDEAANARDVAQALGTNHHEVYLTGTDAREVIPDLPDIYSEPFADSSQIPTYLISRFARQHVTVTLSGDGGDEVFGGYNRHIYAQRLSGAIARWPASLRNTAANAITSLSPTIWDTLLRVTRQPQAGDRIHKLATALKARDVQDLYQRLQSVWPNPTLLVPGATSTAVHHESTSFGSLAAEMMLHDFLHYLPTDPLHKVDRASMAVSLEVRCPLLDMRVVEAAWALPEHQKLRDGKGKWVLREIISKNLPQVSMRRPKQGFGVPMSDWLRGPLREWAENLLSGSKLQAGGHLNPSPIREAWELHLSNKQNLGPQLWTVLMFQAWSERWL